MDALDGLIFLCLNRSPDAHGQVLGTPSVAPSPKTPSKSALEILHYPYLDMPTAPFLDTTFLFPRYISPHCASAHHYLQTYYSAKSPLVQYNHPYRQSLMSLLFCPPPQRWTAIPSALAFHHRSGSCHTLAHSSDILPLFEL